jgi:hypothetical protein
MDAGGAKDESATCGRRSRVVLTPRRWRQVGGSDSASDGGKQARSPGRARNKLLKPSRAGMPGDPGATVVTNARVYYTPRAAAGATGTRHSPLPPWGSPTPFAGRIVHAQLGRIAPRDHGFIFELSASLRAQRSNPLLLLYGLMDCFASLAMTISRRLAPWLFENRISKSRRFRPSSAAPVDGFRPATARWFAT